MTSSKLTNTLRYPYYFKPFFPLLLLEYRPKVSLLLDAIGSRRESVANEVFAFVSSVIETFQEARVFYSRGSKLKINLSFDLSSRFEGGHMLAFYYPCVMYVDIVFDDIGGGVLQALALFGMRSLLENLLGSNILSKAFNSKKAVDIWSLYFGLRGAQVGFILTPLQAAATSRAQGGLLFVRALLSYMIRSEYDSTFRSRGINYENAPRNIDISFIRELRQAFSLALFGGQDRVAAYLLRMLMPFSAHRTYPGDAEGESLMQGLALQWQSLDWNRIVDQCASHGLYRTLSVIFFHICGNARRTLFLESVGLFDLFHEEIIDEKYLREKYECACMSGHARSALVVIRFINANGFSPPAVWSAKMSAQTFMEVSRGLLNKKPRPIHKMATMLPISEDDDPPAHSLPIPSSAPPHRVRRGLWEVPHKAGTRPGAVKILRSGSKTSTFRSFGRSIFGPTNSAGLSPGDQTSI
jgi:hypothetical protein